MAQQCCFRKYAYESVSTHHFTFASYLLFSFFFFSSPYLSYRISLLLLHTDAHLLPRLRQKKKEDWISTDFENYAHPFRLAQGKVLFCVCERCKAKQKVNQFYLHLDGKFSSPIWWADYDWAIFFFKNIHCNIFRSQTFLVGNYYYNNQSQDQRA